MHEHMHTPSITPLFVRCGQSLEDGTGQQRATQLSWLRLVFEFASDPEWRSASRELCTRVTYGVHTGQVSQHLVLG